MAPIDEIPVEIAEPLARFLADHEPADDPGAPMHVRRDRAREVQEALDVLRKRLGLLGAT